jgi:hypothetical protein
VTLKDGPCATVGSPVTIGRFKVSVDAFDKPETIALTLWASSVAIVAMTRMASANSRPLPSRLVALNVTVTEEARRLAVAAIACATSSSVMLASAGNSYEAWTRYFTLSTSMSSGGRSIVDARSSTNEVKLNCSTLAISILN